MKVTKLVINRGRWFRGERRGSRLRRESDGKMCCLGFHAIACGATPEQITEVAAPADFLLLQRGFVYGENKLSSQIIAEAIQLNDNVSLSDQEREQRLKRTFAKAGIEVEFV